MYFSEEHKPSFFFFYFLKQNVFFHSTLNRILFGVLDKIEQDIHYFSSEKHPLLL